MPTAALSTPRASLAVTLPLSSMSQTHSGQEPRPTAAFRVASIASRGGVAIIATHDPLSLAGARNIELATEAKS